MRRALTREEELIRRARSREVLPRSQSSMSKGRRAKSAQFGGTGRNTTGQSPAWPLAILDSILWAKRSPRQILGKIISAAVLKTTSTRLQQTTLT